VREGLHEKGREEGGDRGGEMRCVKKGTAMRGVRERGDGSHGRGRARVDEV